MLFSSHVYAVLGNPPDSPNKRLQNVFNKRNLLSANAKEVNGVLMLSSFWPFVKPLIYQSKILSINSNIF